MVEVINLTKYIEKALQTDADIMELVREQFMEDRMPYKLEDN